eukprot:COSAG05_NODE_22466_length_264_cov_2.175758_1_plen_54_part_01
MGMDFFKRKELLVAKLATYVPPAAASQADAAAAVRATLDDPAFNGGKPEEMRGL